MNEHQHHHHHAAGETGVLGRHYCVNDGSRLTVDEIEGRPLEACDRCGFVLWRDPKVATAALVTDPGGRLLLARRATQPGYGSWCLPGGFVNDDEHPAEGAARECREEIGCQVLVDRLVGVYHVPKEDASSMVVIGYAGRLQGGEPHPGPEMLEVASFAPDRVPELAFSSHREALADWLRGHR
ncbi:MAG: NUDIX hydrolase [Candidatus Dormibacteraceae bacterium]